MFTKKIDVEGNIAEKCIDTRLCVIYPRQTSPPPLTGRRIRIELAGWETKEESNKRHKSW